MIKYIVHKETNKIESVEVCRETEKCIYPTFGGKRAKSSYKWDVCDSLDDAKEFIAMKMQCEIDRYQERIDRIKGKIEDVMKITECGEIYK